MFIKLISWCRGSLGDCSEVSVEPLVMLVMSAAAGSSTLTTGCVSCTLSSKEELRWKISQGAIMKLPPVFLHSRWFWLFGPHLEVCWLNVLIGIIRGLPPREQLFCVLVQCYYSHPVVPLWLAFSKWRRQIVWKKPCQHASCRLKDEEEVKEEKGRRRRRRRRKRGEERRGGLKWKDPTSQIAPITGTFRSQVLQKTLAAVPPNLFPSFSLARCVFCSPFLLPLIFLFSILSYNPSGVTVGEVLPAVTFLQCFSALSLSHDNQGAVKQHLGTSL